MRQYETLRAAIRAVRVATPFHIDARVILPDHMHCIWTLPEDDADFSGRWWDSKVRLSKASPNVGSMRPEWLARDGRGIWQKRFWEHTIRDDRDYRAHIRKCVALGLYDAGWAPADNENITSGMGERS